MRLAIIVALFFCIPTSVQAGEKTILIIESYHAGYAWDADYKKGLTESLGDGYKFLNFEMDTKRLPPSEYENRAKLAWTKYEETKPDLVILGDDDALQLLGPKFLKTTTPVVFLGINNNPSEYIETGKNITGVIERPLFNLSFRTVTQMVTPKPRKILVLFDSSTTSKVSVDQAFKGQTHLESPDSSPVDLKLISTFSEWKTTVTAAKDMGYDAIIVGLYHSLVDASGNHVASGDVMEWTNKNTPVPPFCFWEFGVGKDKTIGGFVLDGFEQGKDAAELVQKIFNGSSPGSLLNKTGKRGKYVFSKKQLERYNLSLPTNIANNDIRFVD